MKLRQRLSEAEPQWVFRFSLMAPPSSLPQVLTVSYAVTGFLDEARNLPLSPQRHLWTMWLWASVLPWEAPWWLAVYLVFTETLCTAESSRTNSSITGESGKNRRHLKAAAAKIALHLFCTCEFPGKVIQSWTLHTLLHVFTIRNLYFVKVSRDTQIFSVFWFI